MNSSLAGILQIVLLVVALAVCYKPLGDYMARIFTSDKHWQGRARPLPGDGHRPRGRPEVGHLRPLAAGVLRRLVLFLYLLERMQHWLPYSNGMANVNPDLAWNTAASFVTNTNWQNYSGESTMGYVVQMAGLAVQNFVSAAVGIVVAIALIRGFMRNKTDRLGNFWVDMTRIVIRLLLPLSVIGGIILMATGVIDNFNLTHTITTLVRRPADDGRRPGGLAGGHQGARQQRRRVLQRELRAPVREPERLLRLVRDLPAAGDPVRAAAAPSARWSRTTGRATCWSPSWCPLAGRRRRHQLLRVAARGHRPAAAGGAMEGKEVRFGIPGSSLFAGRPR
jgi:K+-transporting ATPase ATPase A chain